MKKIKFAAVATLTVLAGAAQAQTSVTVYGEVDTGVLYQNISAASYNAAAKNTGSFLGLKDGGIYTSFLGFKGTEDLGDGWKANFKLQGAFQSPSGKFGLSGTAGQAELFNQ